MRTDTRNQNLRGVPLYEDDGAIVIHTGLSVITRGHLIEVVRDEDRRVATLHVSVIEGHLVTGVEGPDVQASADLLAQRARRFLGSRWKVLGWDGVVE